MQTLLQTNWMWFIKLQTVITMIKLQAGFSTILVSCKTAILFVCMGNNYFKISRPSLLRVQSVGTPKTFPVEMKRPESENDHLLLIVRVVICISNC